MVKKVLSGIFISLTIAMVALCFRIIPALDDATNSEASVVDIYNIDPSSRRPGTMIDITVDAVVLDGGYDAVLDTHYYVVPAGIPGNENVMMLIVMVTDDSVRRGLTALSLNPEAEHVTMKGYLSDIPESNKEQLISGFVAGGISRSEAEQFYNDNIIPEMFVESKAVAGIVNTFGYILMGITGVMVIISVILTIRRFKQPRDTAYSGGYNPQSRYNSPGGYSSPNGYTPPSSGGYRPPSSGGGYRPANSGGYAPPSGNTPQGSSPLGSSPPSARRPYVHPGEQPVEPLTDEFGNPFDPSKLKQPNYNDFFDTKKSKNTAAPAAETKKANEAISDFYDMEMDAIEVPEFKSQKTAAPSDSDFMDDFITPPDISSLDDRSLDSYKPDDTLFSFPKTAETVLEVPENAEIDDLSYSKTKTEAFSDFEIAAPNADEIRASLGEAKLGEDTISDMDLSEYMSADFLNPDTLDGK
ncbi:MAG: hypothetical protein LBL80_03585 [Ruminococcus sp.]|jgi:hypothetical protein|nr:hypothetical protein [Ruminococcus sp.]